MKIALQVQEEKEEVIQPYVSEVSGLQAAVFLSLGNGTVGVVVIIHELTRGRAKGTNSEGGGVERSKAGDNKDKLVKDVSGEIEGAIGVVKEDSEY